MPNNLGCTHQYKQRQEMQQDNKDTGSSTADSSMLNLESPTWNHSCSDQVITSQASSATAQPSCQQFPQALKAHLERGCELRELHIIQLDSQDFFVYCFLIIFPFGPFSSLDMHQFRMLAETKSILYLPNVPSTFFVHLTGYRLLWPFSAKQLSKCMTACFIDRGSWLISI